MDTAELWQVPVTYAAVGATQADDLLKYPPKGYRPLERRIRIGHGDARWEFAWIETMSWGIQRRAGFRVRVLDAPAAVTTGTYTPVTFGDDGEPVQAAAVGEGDELVFAPDGSELVKPGDTALLRWGIWPFRIPARVVYVVDEPNRRGFAYGSLPGHPERGEEAFVVERHDDESVWLVIRAFSRPANALFWLGYLPLRWTQERITRRYQKALVGPLEGD